MSVSFVSSRLSYTQSAGAFSASAPTSIAAGNLLVAICFSWNTPCTMTTVPSGWTLFASVQTPTYDGWQVYWKVASGSEPASYTWQCNQSYCAIDIRQYSGVNTSVPFDGSMETNQYNTGGSTTTMTWSAVTASQAGDMWVIMAGSADSPNAAGLPPSGFGNADILAPTYPPCFFADQALSSSGAQASFNGPTWSYWSTTGFLLAPFVPGALVGTIASTSYMAQVSGPGILSGSVASASALTGGAMGSVNYRDLTPTATAPANVGDASHHVLVSPVKGKVDLTPQATAPANVGDSQHRIVSPWAPLAVAQTLRPTATAPSNVSDTGHRVYVTGLTRVLRPDPIQLISFDGTKIVDPPLPEPPKVLGGNITNAGVSAGGTGQVWPAGQPNI